MRQASWDIKLNLTITLSSPYCITSNVLLYMVELLIILIFFINNKKSIERHILQLHPMEENMNCIGRKVFSFYSSCVGHGENN